MQKKCIKIAIVAYNLEIGGLSRAVIALYNLLTKTNGVSVEVLLLDQYTKVHDCDVYRNFSDYGTKGGGFFKNIKKYIKFKNYIKANKFDFIIDQRFRLNPITELFIAKSIYFKTKTMYCIHSAKLSTYLPNPKWLCRYLYKDAYAVVCCSQGIKSKVKSNYGFTNAVCVYNSINIASHNKTKPAPFNFKYIVAVGRIEPLKQFDKLIKAYSQSNLKEHGIKLVLVGDGTGRSACEAVVKALNLNDDVVFTGFVKQPEQYIQHALCLMLCSKYEGFPMVLLEAMANETPVVSFDLFSGPSEIIIPNVNGILVENQNFESLSLAMNSVLDEEKLLKLKTNTISSIEKFSNEKILNDWLKLMKIES